MDRRYGRMMRRVLAVGLALLAGGALAGAVTLQEEVTPLGSLQEGAKFDQMKVGRDGWCVYVVQRGKQFAVVTGETVGKLYDEIKELDAVAHGTVVYAARTGQTWRLVKDGVEGPEFTDLKEVELSQGGQRLAYAGQRGKQWVVVLDGAEVKTYDDVPLIDFDLSGKRFAHAGQVGKKETITVDGEESEPYDSVRGVEFSLDGTRLAYAVTNAREAFVVVDGARGPAFEQVWFLAPVFSPDGNRVAYCARRTGKVVVVVDGQVSPGYAQVNARNPVFSPDSQHVAYIAMPKTADRYVVVVDGVEMPSPCKGKGWTYNVQWGPDSRRVVYWNLAAIRVHSEWSLIVDNQILCTHRHGRVPVASPVVRFSPSTQQFAFDEPQDGKRLLYVGVTAGRELYDDLISYHFTDESTIEGVARRGLQLVKFVVRISP